MKKACLLENYLYELCQNKDVVLHKELTQINKNAIEEARTEKGKVYSSAEELFNEI